jgi:hypothetical protein
VEGAEESWKARIDEITVKLKTVEQQCQVHTHAQTHTHTHHTYIFTHTLTRTYINTDTRTHTDTYIHELYHLFLHSLSASLLLCLFPSFALSLSLFSFLLNHILLPLSPLFPPLIFLQITSLSSHLISSHLILLYIKDEGLFRRQAEIDLNAEKRKMQRTLEGALAQVQIVLLPFRFPS